jgi:predicted dehydrogenase
MTERVRVGLIGAGIFSRETYIPNLLANTNRVCLTAILAKTQSSIDQTLALMGPMGVDVKTFFGSDGEIDFFAQVKNICDAVLIIVPIPLLGSYVERCLSIGVHVLSEKPVAMTSVEAKRLIGLHQQGMFPASWHVAENYRLEPGIRYARELVKSYPLRPKTFTLIALRQQSLTSKFALTSWRKEPEYHGSYILDGGIHFIALLRCVLDGEVSAVVSTYEERSVVEVGACGSCRIQEALGTFHIRYGALPSPVCRLDVYWDDASMSLIQHRGEGYEVIMTGQEPRRFAFSGLQDEFTLWLDALSGGRADELSPEQSLQDLLAIEQICHTQL